MRQRQRQPKRVQVLEGDSKLDGRAVQQAFDELADHAEQILASPLAGAVLITGVRLEQGKHADVRHGLGREPQGWLQVSAQGLVTALELERDSRRTHLRLAGSFHHPTTAATVSLLVF